MTRSAYDIDGIRVFLPTRISNYRWKYPGQFDYQRAYIELDMPGKTLSVGFWGEIGNCSVPFRVYDRHCIWFYLDPNAKLETVRECVKMIAPLCAELVKTYDEIWDGSNFIGTNDYELQSKISAMVQDFFTEKEGN